MTPWLAGLGLLVSFTATAGTESTIGSSLLPERDARLAPALPGGTLLVGGTGLHDGTGNLLAIARADAPLSATRVGDEPLRAEMKAQARVFPVVQRGSKGDAALSPGASFERSAAALRDSGTSLVFANLTSSVAGVLSVGSATWNPDLEPDLGFVPVPDLGLTTGAGSAASTGAGSADATPAERHDGSTPAIPRAVALSSTTPAPADATPIEVAAASLALPGFSFRADRPDPGKPAAEPDSARHRYADLIVPEAMDKEQRCLAEAVYFEARSEPEEGQAAVAQVVLNRVKSGLYPGNVCGVVYQNRHRYMGCQFSFACEGKSLRITDAGSWQTATRIASAVIEGRTYLSEVGNATHYHADYVRPGWSRRLRKMDVIGRHIFYQLKRGQT
ncbi:ATP-binding protein [Methylobacterium oxalidis]|uniref:ATP-binding protein n=1 Tax=Methylobacterium oxalidis TaxID=944322 RepID=A0A512IWN9_9HYPH|nr:ATP-binding protein [Methylobacterium oxalidis]GJE32132.1 hypothetical protein LDDCCGHA_2315 [Methylobacterium oxalidis]GLS62069.1 ATP-binding protein [Methylobacterium oxalidis]